MRAGRRDLLGKTGHDVIHHRSIQEYIDDIREFGLALTGNSKREILKFFEESAKNKIGFKLQSLKKFMGKRKYLMGYLTLADFELAHCVELFDWICGSCGVKNPFDYFPGLRDIVRRVKRLEGVKELERSERVKEMPWMFKGMAKFE